MARVTLEQTSRAAVPEAVHAKPWFTLWHLLALVVACHLLVTWFFNEHVLTRDVYQRVLSDRLDASRIDDYFSSVRKLRLWAYLLGPLVVVIRVAFMALAVQLALLLVMVEVPFGGVFRAALWAYLAPLAGLAVRAALLVWVDGSEVSPAALSIVPASAASVLMDAADYRSPLYSLLSLVNAFELAWCVIMVIALTDEKKVRTGTAVGAVGGVWLVVTVFQWGLAAFLNRLNG
jgi:hypothetical protein